jgi:hypothetical protein
VFVTATGVVVVGAQSRSGNPSSTRSQLTDKRRRSSTRTPGDHVSGNVEFAPTVVVVTLNAKTTWRMIRPAATERRRRRSSETNGGPVCRHGRSRQDDHRRRNDRIVSLLRPGHTRRRLVIFPAQIMHAGDIFRQEHRSNGFSGRHRDAEDLKKAADYATRHIERSSPGTAPDDGRRSAISIQRGFAGAEGRKKAGRRPSSRGDVDRASFVGYATPAAARLKSNIVVV